MTTAINTPKPAAANDKVWCTDLQQFKYVGVCAKCKDHQTCPDYQCYKEPRMI